MITFKTLASLIAGGTMLVGAPLSYAASQHGGADAGAEVSVEAGTPEVSQPDAPATPEAPTAPKILSAPKAPKVPSAPEAPKAPVTPDVPTADTPSTPQAGVTVSGGSATIGLPTASVNLGS